jgi:hypothetical protein
MNQFSAGMIRLKHFGIQIEVHATAPIHYHVNISTFKLTFASQPNSLHVFAELSAAKVESCQHAKIETNGISFELFWTFQTAQSWDLKRSSPEREMFNLLFNGAMIQPLDCAAYDEMVAIVTRSLNDFRSRKRPSETEETFVQATVCISCTWDDTYKHRGTCGDPCRFQLISSQVPMVPILKLANGQSYLKHAVSCAMI